MSIMPETLVQQYNVSRESQVQLETYVRLLLQWQERINLIGPSTIAHVWQRHIADALQLLPLFTAPNPTIADLGSGAGFPGLALAMMGATHVHLYESVGKKVAFMREIIRQTKALATVHQLRIEDLKTTPKLPKVQFVTARAFAGLGSLLTYAEPLLKDQTRGLFHKGQDVDTELNEAAKDWALSYTKHPSNTDSQAVILEVWEVRRVGSQIYKTEDISRC